MIRSFAHFWWATWANHSLWLIFGEWSEQFDHSFPFVMSNLSEHPHRSLKKREWAIRSFSKNLSIFFFKYQKYDLFKFCWVDHSFFVSKRGNEQFAPKNKWFANSLFYHEQPEQIAHSHSFVMTHERPQQFAHGRSFFLSNLSDLLPVVHLSWAIWANCSQLFIKMNNFEQMSEFPTLEWREWIAHGLSFVKSDMSKWLTVGLL